MSVLTNYVERLERSIDRNQAILSNDLREFEEICQRAVEGWDTTLMHQAEKLYKRALARFREVDQVVQVLQGPRYRGLTHPVAQRESALLTLQVRYHQAFSTVERSRKTTPDQDVEVATPRLSLFRAPKKVHALEKMFDSKEPGDRSTSVSFIVIKGDSKAMREVCVNEDSMREGDVIERFDETEVRIAMRHPAALSHKVIEAAVVKRLLNKEGLQVRAAIYRLVSRDELETPFLSAIHLNLPRVPNRQVLTLNPVGMGNSLVNA